VRGLSCLTRCRCGRKVGCCNGVGRAEQGGKAETETEGEANWASRRGRREEGRPSWSFGGEGNS
jgi:hypothetical protein